MAKKKRKLETPRTLHDWPLTHDQEALFSFDDFAATLARLIADKETKTPLTIGISGRWGSGKTTLLRRVERMLEQTEVLYDNTKPAVLYFCNDEENPQAQFRPCRTVWFNAWKYADEDELLVALVRVIVQAMYADDFISKSAATILDPLKDRRDVIETVLGWFAISAPYGGFVTNLLKPKPTKLGEKTAILDLFDKAFDRLLAAWVHRKMNADKINPEEGVLVIFIDDLDRCLPPKMVQVLEAVKLFMDKRGCVFLLGADTEIVRRAVEKQYEQAGVTGQGAGDYLEKIVQLRFELPPATHDTMQELLDNEKMIGEDWGDSWRLLVTGAEINPRKVKTFVNDLNLQWAMLVNSGQARDVNRADFNAWQVLARIAPRNFLDQIRERLEDLDLRYKFVMDAIKWSQGEESLNATFQQYDSWRLKRVLRDLAFGESFNPLVLNAFVHLTAPPQIEELVEEKPLEKGAEILPELDENVIEVASLKQKHVMRGAKSEITEVQMRSGIEVSTFAKMPFMCIPAGKFLMGDKDYVEFAKDAERPQHTLEIPYDYYMARFPVTTADFARFADARDYKTVAEKVGESRTWMGFEWVEVTGANWKNPLGPKLSNPEGLLDHPVVHVSWHDTQEYIAWLNENYAVELPKDYYFILPSEAEWEKAARGEYGNIWPWGNIFDVNKCNSIFGGIGGTTKVGKFSPAGDSPYGCADMVGNVWEWTRSLIKGYPYDASDGRENDLISTKRIVRGGSFLDGTWGTRCAARGYLGPDPRDSGFGFRVCVSPVELQN